MTESGAFTAGKLEYDFLGFSSFLYNHVWGQDREIPSLDNVSKLIEAQEDLLLLADELEEKGDPRAEDIRRLVLIRRLGTG